MKRLLFILGLTISVMSPICFAAPAITSVNKNNTQGLMAARLVDGDSLVITGTSFGASQGAGSVNIASSPFSGSGYTAQTVTSWANTSITVTVEIGAFAHGDYKFLSVTDNAGLKSTGIPGYIQTSTPTITGYNGVMVHTSTAAVVGSGFGTRNDYHGDSDKLSKFWDDWNDGEKLSSTYGSWTSFGSFTDVSNTSPRTVISGDNYYKRTCGTGSCLGYLYKAAGNNNEYYSACWYKQTLTTFNTGGQAKIIRLGVGGTGNRNFYPNIDLNNSWYQNFEFFSPTITGSSESNWNSSRPTKFVTGWHYLEIYMRKESSDGARDGEFWTKWDGVPVFDWWQNFQVTDPNSDGAGEFDGDGASFSSDWAIGAYGTKWLNTTEAMQFDDIVLDHTLARVVIGDASTFAACAQFEYQPQSAWDDDTVTFTVNRGEFSAAETAYLYVVDRYGFVNPSGFSITFGGSGGESPPAEPDPTPDPGPPPPPPGGSNPVSGGTGQHKGVVTFQ